MLCQKLKQTLTWLTLLVALQGSIFVSLANADKPPTAPLVVIERQEFVDLLARYQFLTEERDALTKIVDAQRAQIDAVRAESASKTQLIDQLQAQLQDSQSKLAVVEEDRERLESQLKSNGFWDTVKNYLLIFVGGIAAAALLF